MSGSEEEVETVAPAAAAGPRPKGEWVVPPRKFAGQKMVYRKTSTAPRQFRKKTDLAAKRITQRGKVPVSLITKKDEESRLSRSQLWMLIFVVIGSGIISTFAFLSK
jgi:hypothetical protein|tara:strand:+ start:211 stop:531 length:321 start_codon:yes stop_codon:yes gene_type:complete